MIEQWMHVRAKNTEQFLFENSNRPKFNDGEKFRDWPKFLTGQNVLIYSILKEMKRKEGAKAKVFAEFIADNVQTD